MRKLAVFAALASTVLATPALARDKSWYVGADAGAMIVENLKFDIGATKSASSMKNQTGWDVDGNIGYDFGAFRLEAEVGYKNASAKRYTSTIRTPNTTTGFVAGAYQGDNVLRGHASALSFMVNGLLDFGDDDGIQGFVGGGVGVARVQLQDTLLPQASRFLDDSDTVFAWQGLAGIRAPLTKNLDASLKYRFFNANSVKLIGVEGSNYNTRFRSHSLSLGLTYNFGAPEEPAPPPPPPPPAEPPAPPPAPTTAPCSPGPFIVFFEWDKSDITPEAASILDNAIAQYANCGSAQVMLAGFADRSGKPSYNVGLSQRRADSVKAYLSSHSIPESVVTTQAFGEDPAHLRVQTADGVREVQNRRVEITYGPGSGQ